LGDHEVDCSGVDMLGRHDQVTFVFPVLVVDHDDQLASGDRSDGRFGILWTIVWFSAFSSVEGDEIFSGTEGLDRHSALPVGWRGPTVDVHRFARVRAPAGWRSVWRRTAVVGPSQFDDVLVVVTSSISSEHKCCAIDVATSMPRHFCWTIGRSTPEVLGVAGIPPC
jgi:hypothetical protein